MMMVTQTVMPYIASIFPRRGSTFLVSSCCMVECAVYSIVYNVSHTLSQAYLLVDKRHVLNDSQKLEVGPVSKGL